MSTPKDPDILEVKLSAPRPRAAKKTYLGDGAYAHFDGFYIWLTTERENGEHRVALDPAGLSELIRLADQVWKRNEVRS